MKKIISILISKAFKLRLTKSRKLGELLEVNYWNNAPIPEWKLDPKLPLQKRLIELLPDNKKVKILDVGAGMLTTVRKKHPEKYLHIIAIDPLAKEYYRILNRKRIIPPVVTSCLSLSNFREKTFDIVYARNSIDHSVDPIKEIYEMIRVCKGWVLMEHFVDTGKKENYRGLHQWNFNLSNGDLTISNRKKSSTIISKYFHNEIINESGRQWIITKIDCRN
jgi:ubiquinone/menaquinone biosynthesis C-methylase UbiE